jgi:hypothetical protein
MAASLTIKRLLAWLTAAQWELENSISDAVEMKKLKKPKTPALFDRELGERILLLVRFLNWKPTNARRDNFRRHWINRWLKEVSCYAQLEWDESGSCKERWIATGRACRGFQDVVTDVLSLNAQRLLFRFRECAAPRCSVWFYAVNAKRTTHTAACRHALSYVTLDPTAKKKRRRDARNRMRKYRAAQKARDQAQLTALRKATRP